MNKLFAALSILMNYAPQALANCSDEIVADCGDFKVVLGYCSASDTLDAQSTLTVHAQAKPGHNGPNGEFLAVDALAHARTAIYRLPLDSDSDQYLEVRSNEASEYSYSTYKGTWKEKDPPRACEPAQD